MFYKIVFRTRLEGGRRGGGLDPAPPPLKPPEGPVPLEYVVLALITKTQVAMEVELLAMHV